MTSDDTLFRKSMRLLASGVTIVASAHEGRRSGLTATAVCSLALSPPRILASINMQGHTYEVVENSRCMSVNLLAENQQELAERFAARRATEETDRFVHGNWTTRMTGAPILADGLAALDCRVTNIIPLDTHAILIGEVQDIVFGPHAAPLIHFEAAYTSILAAHSETTS